MTKNIPFIRYVLYFFVLFIFGCSVSIFQTVKSNNYSELQKWLQSNGNVDERDQSGNTPLMIASEKGYLPLVKLFISHHADINAVNKNRENALILAANNKHLEVVKFLIQNKANVNQSSKFLRKTVLQGKSFNLINYSYATPLLIPIEQENIELLNLLLKANVDVNVIFSKWEKNRLSHCEDTATPLMLAVKNNQLEITKLLIDNDADVNLKNHCGLTPIMIAAKHGHAKITDLLIQSGANINAKEDKGKRTPLMIASKEGHTSLVKLLLQNGANVNDTAKDNSSAVYYALFWDHAPAAKILIEHGADLKHKDIVKNEPLHLAAGHGYTDLVTLMMKNGSNINALNGKRETALLIATKKQHVDTVLELMKYNPKRVKGAIHAAKKMKAFELAKQIKEYHDFNVLKSSKSYSQHTTFINRYPNSLHINAVKKRLKRFSMKVLDSPKLLPYQTFGFQPPKTSQQIEALMSDFVKKEKALYRRHKASTSLILSYVVPSPKMTFAKMINTHFIREQEKIRFNGKLLDLQKVDFYIHKIDEKTVKIKLIGESKLLEHNIGPLIPCGSKMQFSEMNPFSISDFDIIEGQAIIKENGIELSKGTQVCIWE
ncbi:MAG: ankyrin repeat domain-containing protein [Thermodesulfobacteriota bacterium]|nr:ankyrin repeat domain-containing protein [Thermodesulfobacteriota bacterium]